MLNPFGTISGLVGSLMMMMIPLFNFIGLSLVRGSGELQLGTTSETAGAARHLWYSAPSLPPPSKRGTDTGGHGVARSTVYHSVPVRALIRAACWHVEIRRTGPANAPSRSR